MNIGPFEAVALLLALISAVWVFLDAQKQGYSKFHAVLWGLFSMYPAFPIICNDKTAIVVEI